MNKITKTGPSLMLVTLASLSIFYSCNKTGKSHWKEVFSYSEFEPRKVQILSMETGYAIANDNDGLIKTENGGRIWTDCNKSFSSGYRLRWADFIAEREGICCTSDGASTRLYKTSDGGKSWFLYSSSSNSPALAGRVFLKIKMSDKLNGVAYSSDNQNELSFFSTIDGGVKWAYQGKVTIPSLSTEDLGFHAFKNHLYILTLEGDFFYSANSGKTWTKSIVEGGWSSADRPCYNVVALDSAKLMAKHMEGIYTSTNAGKNWKRLLFSGGTPMSLTKDDDGSILLVTEDAGYYFNVMTSKDFGSTWTTERLGKVSNSYFSSIDKHGGKGLIFCGEKVFKYIP